jgi:hypothetical protein
VSALTIVRLLLLLEGADATASRKELSRNMMGCVMRMRMRIGSSEGWIMMIYVCSSGDSEVSTSCCWSRLKSGSHGASCVVFCWEVAFCVVFSPLALALISALLVLPGGI